MKDIHLWGSQAIEGVNCKHTEQLWSQGIEFAHSERFANRDMNEHECVRQWSLSRLYWVESFHWKDCKCCQRPICIDRRLQIGAQREEHSSSLFVVGAEHS